ncbi:LHFPL tetraspan subfamily member 6 protein isoform X3 [Solenopsis invicta]|uniref:LHFPL tetraspan subfamily member 6 protein isoform X3 n=1 Tax=Solenopsis invicta TaxID=13686 RepID=UPI000E33FF5E|nr:LHFPL tetraspan subfamily member 6 protein isoform X3 [Solenopsis invicta]
MTVLCVLWATLSTVASILACSGFYLPYWIQGRLLGKADAYFSSFRRCNYPRIRAPNATPEIVYECARYSSFWDIPSAWWQASTVTMGIGVAIAVIGALTLLAAASSFLPHILRTPKHTRILGSLQLLAAAMICGGLVMYPIGWDNGEVRESCGKGANVYNLDLIGFHGPFIALQWNSLDYAKLHRTLRNSTDFYTRIQEWLPHLV